MSVYCPGGVSEGTVYVIVNSAPVPVVIPGVFPANNAYGVIRFGLFIVIPLKLPVSLVLVVLVVYAIGPVGFSSIFRLNPQNAWSLLTFRFTLNVCPGCTVWVAGVIVNVIAACTVGRMSASISNSVSFFILG